MGGYQYRHAHLVKRHEHLHDISRIIRVKIAGWLIRDEYRRPVDYCAGNTQALLLPARKRNGPRFFPAQQAYFVQRCAYSSGRRLGAKPAYLQREQYILENIAVEQNFLILKHQTEVAPQEWDRAALDRADILAVDDNAAGGRTFDGGNKPQQRSLARARMAGDQAHLAGFKGKTNIPERFEAVWDSVCRPD